MTHPLQQTDRAFGLMFAAVLSVVALFGFLVFGVILIWVIVAAGTFLALAILLPWILLPLNRLWSAFAARFALVNNYIILGAFYYLIVAPMGLIMRLFSDPMHRKIAPSAKTYWSAVGRKAEAETYRDLF